MALPILNLGLVSFEVYFSTGELLWASNFMGLSSAAVSSISELRDD